MTGNSLSVSFQELLPTAWGFAGMAPGPNISLPHPQHKVYPYLLRGVVVARPNQVWSTDITYIRLLAFQWSSQHFD